MIKTVFKEDPISQIPLDIPRLRQEDSVKRNVKIIDPRVKWREIEGQQKTVRNGNKLVSWDSLKSREKPK